MRVNKKLFKAFGGKDHQEYKTVNFSELTGGFLILVVGGYILFSVLTFFQQSDKEIATYEKHCAALADGDKWFISRNVEGSTEIFGKSMACNVLRKDKTTGAVTIIQKEL